MKKCPKCGTILDDSKKKCYMCGANLVQSSSVSDFSSNFDTDIGATVSKGSDNVFNNGKDIDVDSSEILDGEENHNGSFFSHNSAAKDYFGGEINKLNKSKKTDTKKKKGLFGESNSKKKDIPKEMMDSLLEKKKDEKTECN